MDACQTPYSKISIPPPFPISPLWGLWSASRSCDLPVLPGHVVDGCYFCTRPARSAPLSARVRRGSLCLVSHTSSHSHVSEGVVSAIKGCRLGYQGRQLLRRASTDYCSKHKGHTSGPGYTGWLLRLAARLLKRHFQRNETSLAP